MFRSGIKGEKIKIFLLPSGENVLAQDSESELIKLPHPRSGHLVLFLAVNKEEKCELFEVNQYKSEPSSWFLDDMVKSDGSLNIVTKYDPLYLLLPFFEKCSGDKFHIVDQMVECEHADLIISSLQDKQLEKISDCTTSGSFTAYKYNEQKTLLWLKAKIENVVKMLNSTCIYNPEESGEDLAESEKENKLRCAWGMISEYLSENMKEKLRVYLKISVKRKKPAGTDNENSKKAKVTANEDYSTKTSLQAPKPSKPLSRAAKALQKIDKKGMKSISSFFKPKGGV